MPCISTSDLVRVLAAWLIDANHISISAGVTDSIAMSPNRGSSCERTMESYPDTVDGLRRRSCSTYRSHAAAASANVAPVRTIPGSVPRRASSSVFRSQASASRFVR